MLITGKYKTIMIDPPWPHRFDGPSRLEMFARARRAGWDAYGDEVESDIDIEEVA